MTPDMLMQPFEQSFNALPMNNDYYNNSMMMVQENTMLGYSMPVENLDFRPTFYNPFEIKHRRRTSRAQLKVLEESFSDNPKPNATVRRILAQQLDMTPRGVQIWFQNRRAKAKLLRRKSAAQTETASQEKPHSPVASSYPPMPSNVSARSIATAAAATCIFDACASECSKAEEKKPKERYAPCEKQDQWPNLPLHPLAPVIDDLSLSEFSPVINSDEWRRRSCPALGSNAFNERYELMWSHEYNGYQQIGRRMTAENVYPDSSFQTSDLSRNPFTSYNDCHPSQWSSPASVDFFQTFNYSPVSQQMTPRLSTGSPISVEGGYYDPCFDLMLSSSSSPAPML